MQFKIIHTKNVHNHEADDRKLERQELRINAQRKATKDPTARPSKIINKELTSIDENFLHQEDLKNVSKTIYRERRKRHPTLSKSWEDLHTTISNMTIETSKSENFLQINNLDNGIIILNLECLCSVDEIFMDGTFRCCPKFFPQLYTIPGYKKGNYSVHTGAWKIRGAIPLCIFQLASFVQ
jgi:predicted ATP-dependent endonuclease of OLD family